MRPAHLVEPFSLRVQESRSEIPEDWNAPLSSRSSYPHRTASFARFPESRTFPGVRSTRRAADGAEASRLPPSSSSSYPFHRAPQSRTRVQHNPHCADDKTSQFRCSALRENARRVAPGRKTRALIYIYIYKPRDGRFDYVTARSFHYVAEEKRGSQALTLSRV